MKIKLYIVTYQGHRRLNPTLNSLINSDLIRHDYEINIINNNFYFILKNQEVNLLKITFILNKWIFFDYYYFIFELSSSSSNKFKCF